MSRSVLIKSVLLEVPRVVFTGIVVGEEHRRRFVSAEGDTLPRSPQVGEIWRIGGRITRHPHYGEQIRVDSGVLEKSSGHMVVHVLSGPRFEGIGPKTAERLWQTYGEDLYRILSEGDEDALAAVTGCDPRGRTRAAALVEAWQSLALETDTMAWLDRYAVDPGLAIKLVSCYGSGTISAVTEDPYRLTVFGASWDEADKVARALGIGGDHPLRLGAAVDHCAHQRFSGAGDTWATEADLRSDLVLLLGPELARSALSEASSSAAISTVLDGYQTAGCHALEHYVAQALAHRLRQADAEGPANTEEAIDRWQGTAKMILNDGQRRAVATALSAPFSVITGGAGTGKTATLKAIAELAQDAGETVLLLALSGRAALRITEATGLDARTIAGFLQVYERRLKDLPKRSLVIIDEASMVDITLLYRVISVLGDDGRLLLVGDPGQLPPIGPGLTLHVLAEHQSVSVAVLRDIVRQAAATGIPTAGQAIRDGILPATLEGNASAPGVKFIDCKPEHVAETAITFWRAEAGRAQMISAFKGNASADGGIHGLNGICHDARSASEPAAFGRFKRGEPVIWTQNDYDLGLMNGELGTVREVAIAADGEGSDSLVVDFGGKAIAISWEAARHLELAYAITVHKAQGSAFDVVVIPVVEHPLLDRTMIYTALTRARQKAILVGDRRVLRRAVEEPPSSTRRRSALAWHLDRELETRDSGRRHACMET
jgi:exodeoxyribonuclease V alpha subunit